MLSPLTVINWLIWPDKYQNNTTTRQARSAPNDSSTDKILWSGADTKYYSFSEKGYFFAFLKESTLFRDLRTRRNESRKELKKRDKTNCDFIEVRQ